MSPIHGSFADVDASLLPERWVAYLDAASADETVARYKVESLAWLGPRPGQRALDVACGAGDEVRALARAVAPGGQAIGVDASAVMIAVAVARTPLDLPARFMEADATALPFTDGSFDLARADRVLHFVADPAAVVAEVARVLAPGGRVTLSEPDWSSLSITGADERRTALVLEATRSGRRRMRGEDLASLAGAAGLRVERVIEHRVSIGTYDFDRDLFHLAAAARAPGVPPAEGVRWLVELRRASAEGRLTLAMDGATACATRD